VLLPQALDQPACDRTIGWKGKLVSEPAERVPDLLEDQMYLCAGR